MAEHDSDAGAGGDNVAEFTVSELSFALKSTIENAYGFVRVRGELGRISRPASGHVYLDLKDDKSVLAGVIWRGAAAKLAIQPEQGLEVIATGRLTTYPGQSRYQIVIEALEPAGLGALMALLEERRKKLAAEGLFDEALKKPLPYLPRVIGVVTSPTGAVIRDILHRLADRFPVHVLVWPVRVQGETSAAEVARAIGGFNNLEKDGAVPRPDLIIVARGGGSVEDLWGFNDEAVVRAAADSAIPLVSAVGHETDWTLIDYAADLRAPTPTGAAELAVPVRVELLAQTGDLSARLRRAGSRILADRAQALRSAARGLPRLDDVLGLPRQRLDTATARLPGALSRMLETRLSAFQALAHGLKQASRFNVQAARSALGAVSARFGAHAHTRAVIEFQRAASALGQRLTRATTVSHDRLAARLDGTAKLLSSLGHHSVLKRGFVRVLSAAGRTLPRAALVNQGDSVTLEFFDGTSAAEIVEPAKKKPSPKAGGGAKKPGGGQGTLF